MTICQTGKKHFKKGGKHEKYFLLFLAVIKTLRHPTKKHLKNCTQRKERKQKMNITQKSVEDIKKILVIGSGGREHSIIWKLRQDGFKGNIICIPGNAGISKIAKCIPLAITRHQDILNIANLVKNMSSETTLTIVGPEIPLALGIVDEFKKRNLLIFGPTKEATQIESSKAFCDTLMKENKIPTGDFKIFTEYIEALNYSMSQKLPIVIKADGLAAGKGVYICEVPDQIRQAINEIMLEKKHGDAGNKVIIKEYLTGEEASFMAFVDGDFIMPIATSQDHKAINDGDKGLNTGGMGAYSPAPIITYKIHSKIMDKIMYPILQAMRKKGIVYKGILYAGIIINGGEDVKVLEFNCRFGDPEIQPILMRMKSPLLPIILATIAGDLSGIKLKWKNESAVCVVASSKGYPDHYETGKIITGLNSADDDLNTEIFHAGTKIFGDKILTYGGRVLGATALGANLGKAIENSYDAMKKIHFDGMHYRKDIGKKGLLLEN
ncbi:phosphoribosylamine--glycine ligase [Patescibacteria group bacterium]